MKTAPPLLDSWLSICDDIARDCPAARRDAGAYSVALGLASKMVWDGAEDRAEVVRFACQTASDPERVHAILTARAADESSRRKDSQSRAYRRAEAVAPAGPSSTKRRGSPKATHRSNRRSEGERWDLEHEGDE